MCPIPYQIEDIVGDTAIRRKSLSLTTPAWRDGGKASEWEPGAFTSGAGQKRRPVLRGKSHASHAIQLRSLLGAFESNTEHCREYNRSSVRPHYRTADCLGAKMDLARKKLDRNSPREGLRRPYQRPLIDAMYKIHKVVTIGSPPPPPGGSPYVPPGHPSHPQRRR